MHKFAVQKAMRAMENTLAAVSDIPVSKELKHEIAEMKNILYLNKINVLERTPKTDIVEIAKK